MAKKAKATITPLGDRVLVRLFSEKEGERTLDSGLILPASVKGERDSAKRGEVVSIGEGKYEKGELRPVRGVSKGDTVLFSWGDQLMIEEEEYYLVGESNLLAVLKN